MYLINQSIPMKKFEISFLHTDGSTRKIVIEAFDQERAECRFEVNWGTDMKILGISPLITLSQDSGRRNDTNFQKIEVTLSEKIILRHLRLYFKWRKNITLKRLLGLGTSEYDKFILYLSKIPMGI